MRKLIHILIVSLFTCVCVQAQNPLQFRKIQVLDTARIALEWETQWSPNVKSCELLRARQATTEFVQIASFTQADDGRYCDTNLQTNSTYYSYFLRLHYKDDTYSTSSDTLSSIVLFALSKNSEGIHDGIAYLKWNDPQKNEFQHPIASVQKFFFVERSDNNSWRLIDSLSTLVYNDSLYVCDSVFAYRIQFTNGEQTLISNTVILQLRDILEPLPVVFDSVSVDNETQKVVLGWQASTSPDVVGYVILKMRDISLHPVDTVWGALSCFYQDENSHPQLQEQYRVQAIDGCFNGSLFIQKRSILLGNTSFPQCADSIHIGWSSQRDMLDSLAYFEIFHSYQDEAFKKIARVAPHADGVNYPRQTKNGLHRFFVRAWNFKEMSSSTLYDTLFVEEANLPTLLYLHKLTQVENGEILLSAYIDSNSLFKCISVYRKENRNSDYTLVGEIDGSVQGQNYTFLDKTANANKGERFYTLVLQDTCSRDVLKSQECVSIYLQREMLEMRQIRLFWNAYEGWLTNEFEYALYRKHRQDLQVEELSRIPASESEDVYAYVASFEQEEDISQWIYYVQAMETSPDIYGFQDTVKSNELMVLNEGSPIFYMPTAFNPRGINPYYKPIGIFSASDIFSFRIFDRWGKMIFESVRVDQAWDGKYKGAYVHPGVYVYNVSVIRNGQKTKMSGYITVI